MPKIISAIADKMDEDDETKNTIPNEGSIAPHLNAMSGWTDGLDLTPRAPCGARKTSLQLVKLKSDNISDNHCLGQANQSTSMAFTSDRHKKHTKEWHPFSNFQSNHLNIWPPSW